MRILALDPGGTTGWAVVVEDRVGRIDMHDCGQLAGEHHQALEAFLDRVMPDVIVCEDFKYRQRAPGGIRMKVELDSVEYIGVVKLWVQKRERKFGFQTELVFQPASVCNGPRLISDEFVKKLGLWTPGRRHAMDAREHLLYYMVTQLDRKDLVVK